MALFVLGGTLLNPLIGQALAQGFDCGDGKSELILILPNGMEKTICVPDSAVEKIEAATENAPIDFTSEKTVFVTSGIYTGDLIEEAFQLTGVDTGTDPGAGLEAGDLICQTLADDAGLGGTYKAWLADDTDSPDTRFDKSTVPYVSTDDVTVANDYTDLTNCSPDCLQTAIEYDENGTLTPSPFSSVWTNVDSFGFTKSLTLHCSNWTEDTFERNDAHQARNGNKQFISAGWTDLGGNGCDQLSHLYCFEQ